MRISIIFFCFLCFLPCAAQTVQSPALPKVKCGDERMDQVLPLLKGKQVALMINQTAVVGNTLLLDTFLSAGVHIKKIFAPEHGFRGDADAGETVKDSLDPKTGIPVISVYGSKKKPSSADLKGIEIVVFDIQDVGTRFFTFISSLHYLMEACAENKVELVLLDRPNPNGWYVDGPVLDERFKSFVGVDPVPVVYGLTEGEYAMMVNGEGWLEKGVQCQLKVVQCLNYTHSDKVELPVKPSPNLPNATAVMLYPSLCFFEGTNVSVGRGTSVPFQIVGSPKLNRPGIFEFTPHSMPGAKNPPFMNQTCYGFDLRTPETQANNGKFTFRYIIEFYKLYPDKDSFFLKNNFFDKLAGTDVVRKMILDGRSEADIEAYYKLDLEAYKLTRKKYLLYKDFEE